MYKFSIVFFFIVLLAACKTAPKNPTQSTPEDEDDLNTAISFIQSALKGNYDKAKEYMLHDSINDDRLDAVSRVKLSADEKQGLWDATVNIHSRKVINDSTSIIVFSNSFHKENQDTLRVVKKSGRWQVDFKYLFDHGLEETSGRTQSEPF